MYQISFLAFLRTIQTLVIRASIECLEAGIVKLALWQKTISISLGRAKHNILNHISDKRYSPDQLFKQYVYPRNYGSEL